MFQHFWKSSEHHKSGEIKLSQRHLIKRIIKAVFGASGCNVKLSPANTTPIGTDTNGMPCQEKWDYASVVGMMMYQATNSRPDITYAIHQCA